MTDEFRVFTTITKVDKERRIVYGPALVSDTFDAQGDKVSKEDLLEAAHNFMKNLLGVKALPEDTTGQGIGVMHKSWDGVGIPVETWVEKTGEVLTWMLGVYVADDDTWDAVQKGELTGFSIGGRGKRIPIPEEAEAGA